MKSSRSSHRALIKLEYSRQTFKKYSNRKFHKNPSSGSRVATHGQTDSHDDANSRFAQFCERALKDGSPTLTSRTRLAQTQPNPVTSMGYRNVIPARLLCYC